MTNSKLYISLALIFLLLFTACQQQPPNVVPTTKPTKSKIGEVKEPVKEETAVYIQLTRSPINNDNVLARSQSAHR